MDKTYVRAATTHVSQFRLSNGTSMHHVLIADVLTPRVGMMDKWKLRTSASLNSDISTLFTKCFVNLSVLYVFSRKITLGIQ